MGKVSVSLPRKDKKKEIKATLPASVRVQLERRAAAVDLPPTAYAYRLAMAALSTEKVIVAFAPYFKRGYCFGNRALMGRVITPSLEPLLPEGSDSTRFPVKFPPEDHLKVGELAYAFSCSLSATLTVLLTEALLQKVQIECERVTVNG